jgi:hypothetical protein
MVRHAADGQSLEVIHARDAGHVWPEAALQIGRDD